MKKKYLKYVVTSMLIFTSTGLGVQSASAVAGDYGEAVQGLSNKSGEYFPAKPQYVEQDTVTSAVVNLSKQPEGAKVVLGEFAGYDLSGKVKLVDLVDARVNPVGSGIAVVSRAKLPKNAIMAIAYVDQEGRVLDYTFAYQPLDVKSPLPAKRGKYFPESAGKYTNNTTSIVRIPKPLTTAKLVVGSFSFYGSQPIKDVVEAKVEKIDGTADSYAISRPAISDEDWMFVAYIDNAGKILDYLFVPNN